MKYISGWQALNIPNEKGEIADWHPLLHLDKLEYLDSDTFPWKERGISTFYSKYLKQEIMVASFARAIADLVYLNKTAQLQHCVKDFLNDEEAVELYNYLREIKDDPRIDDFLKYECTKLYFKDIQC